MKKEFKVGEWVNVEMEITSINYDHYLCSRSGVNMRVLKDNVTQKEPEFIPRFMMVWHLHESSASKKMVVGMFEGEFLVRRKHGIIIGYKNAKEIIKKEPNVSDEDLLKTFEAWLKQIKKNK